MSGDHQPSDDGRISACLNVEFDINQESLPGDRNSGKGISEKTR